MEFPIQELEERGFVILPDFADSKTVDWLGDAVGQALTFSNCHARGGNAYAMRNLLQTIPAVRSFASSKPVRRLLKRVFWKDGFPIAGILFDKTSAANWKVGWHQDLTIPVCQREDRNGFGPWSVKDGVVHVQPPAFVLEQMLTIRLHLDDCNADNGPLEVLRGSHRDGRLDAAAIQSWRKRTDPVPCVVPRGGAIVFRPLLLHASRSARRPERRRVVHLEFAADPLPGGLKWLRFDKQ